MEVAEHMSFWSWLKGPDITRGVEECRNTPGAVLIDVRSAQEYRMGHIPGSRNVPVGEVSELKMNQDTPIYVYCQSGSRSRQAVRILKKLGCSNVTNLGGINSWSGKRE